MVASSLVVFITGDILPATAVIEGQQTRQLEELTDIALRRSEIEVDFGAATLDELAGKGPTSCDASALQAVRLIVYQRGSVKDIRVVSREGSVLCSAYSETLEFDKGWASRDEMLPARDDAADLPRRPVLRRRARPPEGHRRDELAGRHPRHQSYVFDILPTPLRDHGEVVLDSAAACRSSSRPITTRPGVGRRQRRGGLRALPAADHHPRRA